MKFYHWSRKSFFKFLASLGIIGIALTLSYFLHFEIDSVSRAAVAPITESASDFAKAELTKQALYYISRNYYDPARIQPKPMLKEGLLAMARGVSEILVDFPDNTARITISIENKEKKFTLPLFDQGIDSLIPFLQQVYYFIEKNYKGETDFSDIERMVINGMLETLDPHSSLLTPKIFREFRTQTEGEFGGLGIVIGLKDNELTVISPLEGTPAWKGGIKPKDKILKINNEATINMNLNDAVERLRGKVGTTVILTILREGVTEPFEVTLARAKIKIDSLQSKLLHFPDGDVGYLKIKSFQEDTFRELVRHLDKLKNSSKNFKGLILDFRNNSGGLLNQAVQIADLFLEKGVIVSTVGASNNIREVEEAKAFGTVEPLPLIVLVNESSASASEIVAGALKNNNRAILMGEQTFGKGSVQSVYTLRDNSALKLTIAQYLTPGNESIQSVGITPDIKLEAATVLPGDVHILETDGIREKDLEKHLESNLNQTKKPVYQLRYFVPKKIKPESNKSKDKEEDPDEYSVDLKLDNDYYVNLASKIILSASHETNRPTLLKTIAPLEKTEEQGENQKITAALTGIGIDWSKKTQTETPKAQVSFSMEGKEPSSPLMAGEEAHLTLRVKNTGPGDFHQLIAKTESENHLFKNKEFVFGHLKSGEQRAWTVKVKIPESALSREDEVKFVFQEANGKVPETFTSLIIIQPKALPGFAYSYRLENSGNHFIPLQKGQKVNVVITVKNIGPGRSKETVVNLKNLEGQAIFLAEGRNKLGTIEPGASKEATLSFVIDKTYSKPKINLELSVIDTSTFQNLVDKLTLNLKETTSTPPQNRLQTPPLIELTAIENIRATPLNRFYVSGVANSENPLKDVIIFVGDNKVYLKSAEGESSPKKIHFAAQVPLETKKNSTNNLITVIVRNHRDVTSHKSFYIRKK